MSTISFEPPIEASRADAQDGTIATTLALSASKWAFEPEPVASWRYEYLKRTVDFVGALAMVAVFAIPGLAIAAAILLTSPGPVFYREERIGRNGRGFRIWKFRSMCKEAGRRNHIESHEADETPLQWRMRKNIPDPRITRLGSVLRRWSLDELPQLFNVLNGEMSLVGPRPIVRPEVQLYGDLYRFYLAAVPGISGTWQVSGRSNLSYEQRAILDATYVSNWSLRTDVGILLRTIPAVIRRVGAR